MLRCTRLTRFGMHEVWLAKLTAEKELKKAAASIRKNRQRPVYDHEAMTAKHGEWDPAKAAEYAFRTEGEDQALKEQQQGSHINTARMIAFHGFFMATAPWYVMLWTKLTAWTIWMFAGSSVWTMAAGYVAAKVSQRLHTAVLRLRIVPLSPDTPHGTIIELVVLDGLMMQKTTQLRVPIEQVRLISCDDNGRWVQIAIRENESRVDSYTLVTCPNADKVVPYLVSMKRHYEAVEPTQPPLTLGVAAPAPGDHLKMHYNFQVHRHIHDVTVAEPYPNPTAAYVPRSQDVPPGARSNPVLVKLWEEEAEAAAEATAKNA
eukprot:TRINITY_DN10355_c0_g2_i1.p1 TRINITY_DN10355_c0_g2~~TRINITY_DN10355_c0_g2_i1.p1  ORF type:complete len:338 (+),score=125.52 TRINITY_DN10355_c0_g2_i1:62-1015(+)